LLFCSCIAKLYLHLQRKGCIISDKRQKSVRGGTKKALAWQLFEQKGRGKLQISLLPGGKLGISTLAYELWFKGCSGVILAYDDEKKRIGLKPVSEPRENMYTLNPYRPDRKGGYYIAAAAFFRNFEIPIPEKPIRKKPYEEDGFVVIDLD